MSKDVDISMVGDKELQSMIKELDYRTQHALLKRILRDTSTKTYVKELRNASPVKSGNLRRSFGNVTGKSRRVATIFAGPRMGGSHKGYVANIIEYNKGEVRYPKEDRKGNKKKKRPSTPLGVRVHSGVMPKRPFIRKTLERITPIAERHLVKSVRTIIQRTANKWAKNRV